MAWPVPWRPSCPGLAPQRGGSDAFRPSFSPQKNQKAQRNILVSKKFGICTAQINMAQRNNVDNDEDEDDYHHHA